MATEKTKPVGYDELAALVAQHMSTSCEHREATPAGVCTQCESLRRDDGKWEPPLRLSIELQTELIQVILYALGACACPNACRVHGCRVCGDVILADTESWPAPLCAAHAPELATRGKQ